LASVSVQRLGGDTDVIGPLPSPVDTHMAISVVLFQRETILTRWS